MKTKKNSTKLGTRLSTKTMVLTALSLAMIGGLAYAGTLKMQKVQKQVLGDGVIQVAYRPGTSGAGGGDPYVKSMKISPSATKSPYSFVGTFYINALDPTKNQSKQRYTLKLQKCVVLDSSNFAATSMYNGTVCAIKMTKKITKDTLVNVKMIPLQMDSNGKKVTTEYSEKILTFLVSPGPVVSDKTKIIKCDTNGDGKVTRDDTLEIWYKYAEGNPANPNVKNSAEIIAKLDVGNDSFEEKSDGHVTMGDAFVCWQVYAEDNEEGRRVKQ